MSYTAIFSTHLGTFGTEKYCVIVIQAIYILEWGQGTCILAKHTQSWTYSVLRYFFGPHPKKEKKEKLTPTKIYLYPPPSPNKKVGPPSHQFSFAVISISILYSFNINSVKFLPKTYHFHQLTNTFYNFLLKIFSFHKHIGLLKVMAY